MKILLVLHKVTKNLPILSFFHA